MRHGKKFNHLGRKKAHRGAMLSNMACSLIEHKRITTTLAKAKALRQYVEPLITKSKDDTTHNRRTTFKYLKNKYAVTELFRDIAPKVADRPGGYTRIVRTGYRLGDNAEMCLIELVDFNTMYNSGEDEAKKTRRSRRGGAKKKVGGAIADAASTATNKAADVASKAGDAAGAVADKAKDVAGDVADTAKDVASKVADKAGDVKDAAAEKLSDAKDAASDIVDKAKDKLDDVTGNDDKA